MKKIIVISIVIVLVAIGLGIWAQETILPGHQLQLSVARASIGYKARFGAYPESYGQLYEKLEIEKRMEFSNELQLINGRLLINADAVTILFGPIFRRKIFLPRSFNRETGLRYAKQYLGPMK